MSQMWEIVGGADKGGILVREGQELTSAQAASRLSTGATVEELGLVGERLHYKRVTGTGPDEGWISINLKDKVLAKRLAPEVEEETLDPNRTVVGPGAGVRHRWAVNIDDWKPEGDADGAEFQFLLNLIKEDDDRVKVMKFKFYDDKKRALLSRLLIRQASATSLNVTSFADVTVSRTKGRKPFLESPLVDEKEAPNWNVNVSHEGSWVVAASEPLCLTGIDVAELRRIGPNGQPIDFKKSFEKNLTKHEWDDVNSVGSDLDDQYEVFSRYWSAKEAFVKARGDGIQFDLGLAEFHWKPIEGFPSRTAYEGSIVIDRKAAPLWRFVQHRMPGKKSHWVTVARGPLTDIADAKGQFTATLRMTQDKFSPAEWKDALLAESPKFDIIPIAALVPQDDMDNYVKAGGKRWP